MTRVLLLAFLGAIFVALVLLPTGSAKISGPCTANIAGADFATANVVDVPAGADVPFAFTAEQPIREYGIVVHYGPYTAEPSYGTSESNATTASGEISLADYAWLGAGLYSVTGIVRLADGTDCMGALAINVQGNPLSTAVGATAALVTASTSIGLVTLVLKSAGIILA